MKMKTFGCRFVHAALLLAAPLALGSCGLSGKLGLAACPALGPNVDALAANFSANAQANAKVKVFVQAAKDLHAATAFAEEEAAAACFRIGADIGLPPQAMKPEAGAGGKAAGACRPVAAQIQAILRQGVQLRVTMQPLACEANASAEARCGGTCNVQADAECRASCQAHANAQARCTPPAVNVEASGNAQLAARLVDSLRVNLPALLHAQVAVAQRLGNDVRVIGQVGAKLPNLVGQAGAQALACIGAAADMTASASVRLDVTFRASASVSGSAGFQG